jgi:hypothetical protein
MGPFPKPTVEEVDEDELEDEGDDEDGYAQGPVDKTDKWQEGDRLFIARILPESRNIQATANISQ